MKTPTMEEYHDEEDHTNPTAKRQPPTQMKKLMLPPTKCMSYKITVKRNPNAYTH
jgi:hypothetical protein